MQNNYHSIIAGTVPIPTAVSWTWSPSRSQYVYKVRVAHGNRKDGNTAVNPANFTVTLTLDVCIVQIFTLSPSLVLNSLFCAGVPLTNCPLSAADKHTLYRTSQTFSEGSVTLQLCLELTHRAHARVQTWPRFSPLSMHNGNRNGTTLVASSSFVMPSFLWVSATLYMPTTYIITKGQNNLTKSASPVRGHPRGSKVVPLNSWGRVSY